MGDDPDQISFVPVASNPFKLHLVGKPDPSAAPVLPAALEPVIVIHEDLGYDEFYQSIGDVVSCGVRHEARSSLTAGLDHPRLQEEAVSRPPSICGHPCCTHRPRASLQSRHDPPEKRANADGQTPVLAGEDVLEAYPYLAPPGVVSYETGSTEVEAIAQLRREGIKNPGKVRDWAKYEDSLKRENMAVWAGILRPKEDAPTPMLAGPG